MPSNMGIVNHMNHKKHVQEQNHECSTAKLQLLNTLQAVVKKSYNWLKKISLAIFEINIFWLS
jgi:hypothetical protein